MEMNDEKLYELCRKYGEIALKYRRKFTGLLPEVYKRELYKKKGFGSIFEFAAKLGGVSKEQVSRILHIEEKFQNLSQLHEILVNGEVSVSKLARVVSVATSENQEFLANQVRLLSKSALETLVRDCRVEKQDGLLEPKNDTEFVPGHNYQSHHAGQVGANFSEIEGSEKSAPLSLRAERSNLISPSGELNLSEEVQQKLLELQQKGIDINQLILKLLSEREETIEEEKEEIGEEAQNNFIQYNITESRNVSAKIKKLFKQEYGTKCSIPGCNKPWSDIHHSQRFSLAKIHDPRYMAPLCKSHHAIAHSIDVKVQENRVSSTHHC